VKRLALLVLALALACATARPRPALDASATEAPRDADLVEKNDEELFAIGTAAASAGDDRRAAAAFGRLADAFPESRHLLPALRGAAIALGRQGEWPAALERFRALESRAEGALRTGARFGIAEAHYHLGDLAEAHRILDAVADAPESSAAERIRALAQRGVVELEDGRSADAERSLRAALAAWDDASAKERLAPHDAAQAQFWLGEVYREAAAAIRVDPSTADEEGLAHALEEKSRLLLSAQGHYLRAIRLGDVEFAIAAGARVGELYDGLHEELTHAPLPPGLDGEGEAAYREALRDDLRVLVTKAISAYEQTIDAARRTGIDDHQFLRAAETNLARLKQVAAE
jgi:hypothetical protein